MLVIKNKKLLKKAKRIRWFGIDRLAKQGGTWENDIKEIGYKYQMTDIGAALLLESIKEFSFIKNKRRKIFEIYKKELKNNINVTIVDDESLSGHANWLFTILLDKKIFYRKNLEKLALRQIKFIFETTGTQFLKNLLKIKNLKIWMK